MKYVTHIINCYMVHITIHATVDSIQLICELVLYYTPKADPGNFERGSASEMQVRISNRNIKSQKMLKNDANSDLLCSKRGDAGLVCRPLNQPIYPYNLLNVISIIYLYM